jgi:hypothetical protein
MSISYPPQRTSHFPVFLKSLASGPGRLRDESTLFVLLSALDFVMTWYLLQYEHPGIEFSEANPIARYFIYGWGIKGMFAFKCLIVSFVVALCQVIALSDVKAASRVLWLSCAIVAGVVCYSMLLLCRETMLV